MDSTPPSKDTIWQTGLKRKIWQSVVYKSHTLLTKINTGLGWKAGKRFTKLMAPNPGRNNNTYIRQSRLQAYISQMRQRRSLHTNKRGNSSKGNNNYHLICTQCQCTNFIKHTQKDLKVVVGDFNTPLSPIDRSSRQKNQQRNPRTKWHHRSNRLNWYLQNISPYNSTIYTLLISSWNILQNTQYLGAHAALNKYKKIEITHSYYLITMQ
jgi:hypothetical protein